MPEQSPTRFTMVPARRSSEPTARRRARRILGALFLAAGLSVVATVVALAKGSTKPDLSSVDPQGRDLAYTAAVNFLAGTRQNVPHAESFKPETAVNQTADGRSTPLDYRSLSWVGFSPQHFGSEKLGFTDFEVHHFLVVLGSPGEQPSQTPKASSGAPSGRPSTQPGGRPATAPSGQTSVPGAAGSPSASSTVSPQTGPPVSASPTATATASGGAEAAAPASNVLQLDVPVLLDPKGPLLAASPALSVWKNGVGKVGGRADYTNFSGLTTQVGNATKNQILRWAGAYSTGDSAGLLAVTGDQNDSHRYAGLSGFSLADSPQAVQILSAIKSGNGQVIVRVRILLARAAPAGTVPGQNGADQRFTTFADFDLLVGATGAQPPVLAWGPAGSAAELEPYYNAFTN
ncbi:hypothetical protein ABZ801_18925 [Actinomadura sp. NPDC047616]|uniref:hypothetical protein n=1 Tax=Actinomadura sp. NPDC047616 TaxID=3155914 RepID=UPI0034009109